LAPGKLRRERQPAHAPYLQRATPGDASASDKIAGAAGLDSLKIFFFISLGQARGHQQQKKRPSGTISSHPALGLPTVHKRSAGRIIDPPVPASTTLYDNHVEHQ
jgi:hypothetical protein